jgi:hypothetical protein
MLCIGSAISKQLPRKKNNLNHVAAPYKKYFVSSVRAHFPGAFEVIISETTTRYTKIAADTAFAAKSSNPIDRRLDFCAYFLALIKTLEFRGENYDVIRSLCLEIVHDYVRPKNALQRYLRKLPPKLIGSWPATILLRKFAARTIMRGHPDGFRAKILTDKSTTYGFGYGIDILECGICKLFAKHNASQFAPILCEVDKVTSSLAGLELIRSGTIANGAPTCDFRFKKLD